MICQPVIRQRSWLPLPCFCCYGAETSALVSSLSPFARCALPAWRNYRKRCPDLRLCVPAHRAGDARDASGAANGVPRQPAGVPGGGYAGVNGRAQHSPPGSTVIYTDDEDDDDADEFIEDERCGCAMR